MQTRLVGDWLGGRRDQLPSLPLAGAPFADRSGKSKAKSHFSDTLALHEHASTCLALSSVLTRRRLSLRTILMHRMLDATSVRLHHSLAGPTQDSAVKVSSASKTGER